MLVMAGAKMAHMGVLAGLGVALVGLAVYLEPFRFKRLIAFLIPERSQPYGFQTIQSLYALGSGGLFGMGLGRSRQFFYLPEQHTDFIFAILGEELGFWSWRGIIVVFPLCLARLSHCFKGTRHFWFAFGWWYNYHDYISGCGQHWRGLRDSPVTGIPLPFISFGGSSLVFTLAGVGLLLNISRYSSR